LTFTADCRLVDRVAASPCLEPRRGGARPDMLLLHYTGMASAEAAIARLTRAESRVSAHYLIDGAGSIVQMVPEAVRAWHAGIAAWKGARDINSLAIGIEIHNPGHDGGYPDFPEPQMQALEALCRDIATRWPIPPERVLAHSDVAPKRKADPGEKLDWQRLHRAGVGHWVDPAAVDPADPGLGPGERSADVGALQRQLHHYGYHVPETWVLDAETLPVLRAFQRHFRPARVDGRLDRSTLATLTALLAALPRPRA
jgi:N-acetylmuramoyl-L-alanine amidase